MMEAKDLVHRTVLRIVGKEKKAYLDKCPITGRPFFMEVYDEDNNLVPTYGGPFDSYTIPRKDENDDEIWTQWRYDHDAGMWRGCEEVPEQLLRVEAQESENQDPFLKMRIIDAMMDWCNRNERETIPRRAFHVIAESITRKREG